MQIAHRISKLKGYSFSHAVQQPQNMKKFFKEATFVVNDKPAHPLHKYLWKIAYRYVIKLDAQTMKTPYRHLLAVPNPTLAFLITSEFNRQDKYLKTG